MDRLVRAIHDAKEALDSQRINTKRINMVSKEQLEGFTITQIVEMLMISRSAGFTHIGFTEDMPIKDT